MQDKTVSGLEVAFPHPSVVVTLYQKAALRAFELGRAHPYAFPDSGMIPARIGSSAQA